MKMILVGLISVAAVSFASLPASAQERMRVGLTSLAPTTLPVWVAKRQGYFKDENLSVEPIVFTSDTINSQAALAGEVESPSAPAQRFLPSGSLERTRAFSSAYPILCLSNSTLIRRSKLLQN